MCASSTCSHLWKELKLLDLATPNIQTVSDIICCPGLDYCNLANSRSIPIAQDLSRHFVDVDHLALVGDFTINISGCMNACGHHHVGNIGILGVNKRGKEYFQLTLGGSSDENASLGDRLGRALPAGRSTRRGGNHRGYLPGHPAGRRALPRYLPAGRHRALQGGGI